MGKTSLALSLVDTVLGQDANSSVQIYSLEMPAHALMYRLLAILGQMDVANLMREQRLGPQLAATAHGSGVSWEIGRQRAPSI